MYKTTVFNACKGQLLAYSASVKCQSEHVTLSLTRIRHIYPCELYILVHHKILNKIWVLFRRDC